MVVVTYLPNATCQPFLSLWQKQKDKTISFSQSLTFHCKDHIIHYSVLLNLFYFIPFILHISLFNSHLSHFFFLRSIRPWRISKRYVVGCRRNCQGMEKMKCHTKLVLTYNHNGHFPQFTIVSEQPTSL